MQISLKRFFKQTLEKSHTLNTFTDQHTTRSSFCLKVSQMFNDNFFRYFFIPLTAATLLRFSCKRIITNCLISVKFHSFLIKRSKVVADLNDHNSAVTVRLYVGWPSFSLKHISNTYLPFHHVPPSYEQSQQNLPSIWHYLLPFSCSIRRS